jgi:hypothetical protein
MLTPRPTALTAAAIASSMLLAPCSDAAILVQYGFTGDSDAPTTEAAGLDATDLTSTGISSLGYSNNATGSATGAPARIGAGMNTFSDGQDQDNFFSFTVTPDAGSITVESLDFDYNRSASNSASIWFLQTGVDGFGSDDSNNVKGVGVAANGEGSLTTTSANSASIVFDTPLSISGATEFRLYLARAGGSGSALAIDDITLNGVIPEPASLALLAAGGLCLLPRRRR